MACAAGPSSPLQARPTNARRKRRASCRATGRRARPRTCWSARVRSPRACWSSRTRFALRRRLPQCRCTWQPLLPTRPRRQRARWLAPRRRACSVRRSARHSARRSARPPRRPVCWCRSAIIRPRTRARHSSGPRRWAAARSQRRSSVRTRRRRPSTRRCSRRSASKTRSRSARRSPSNRQRLRSTSPRPPHVSSPSFPALRARWARRRSRRARRARWQRRRAAPSPRARRRTTRRPTHASRCLRSCRTRPGRPCMPSPLRAPRGCSARRPRHRRAPPTSPTSQPSSTPSPPPSRWPSTLATSCVPRPPFVLSLPSRPPRPISTVHTLSSRSALPSSPRAYPPSPVPSSPPP